MALKPPSHQETEDFGLSNCDRELIHVPGSIQPHGLLLTLGAPSIRVFQVSREVEPWLGFDVDDILGKVDDLPPIEGDVMMIRLAFSNLASNAV